MSRTTVATTEEAMATCVVATRRADRAPPSSCARGGRAPARRATRCARHVVTGGVQVRRDRRRDHRGGSGASVRRRRRGWRGERVAAAGVGRRPAVGVAQDRSPPPAARVARLASAGAPRTTNSSLSFSRSAVARKTPRSPTSNGSRSRRNAAEEMARSATSGPIPAGSPMVTATTGRLTGGCRRSACRGGLRAASDRSALPSPRRRASA